MRKKKLNKTEENYIFAITLLGSVLVGLLFLFLIGIEIINDLTATANGYKSDRDICRREYEELYRNYERLDKEWKTK